MSKRHIVLIHGTWCDGNVWGDFATSIADMGLEVHTPSLRYHDLPFAECGDKVGAVTLDDYTDDLVAYIDNLDGEIIILGHSLGSLLAQKVAERVPHLKAMILLGPAPTGDIFAFYPTMFACFYKHYLRWGFWRKSMPPYKKPFFKYCLNEQDDAIKEPLFSTLVPESGKVYAQMAFPFFDKERGAYVDYTKITCPVLVVTGTKDKMTHRNIAFATAKHYRDAEVLMFVGADHMYESGRFKQKTLDSINGWLQKHGLLS